MIKKTKKRKPSIASLKREIKELKNDAKAQDLKYTILRTDFVHVKSGLNQAPLEAEYDAACSIRDHYRTMAITSVQELKITTLRCKAFYTALNEIKEFTTDKYVKGVVDNYIERDNLDKLIHNRSVLDKDEECE